MSDPTVKGETAVSDRRRVMEAAGLVGAAFLASRIVGLVRVIIAKYYLGLALPATAFDTAQRFPESLYLIVAGGAIGSAFIPTFAAYFERNDEPGAWRLFSAVINLTLVTVTAVALVTFVFAEPFVRFFLGNLIADEPLLLPLTVRLMRIMLVSTIIFGVSGIVMGTLNARQHFLLPALAPIIYNLGIIGGALLWGAPDDPEAKAIGMAVGTVAGALGHLLIQIPGLRLKGARYAAVLTLRDPGVRQVLRLMAPRVLGLSFGEINKFATLFLSGLLSAASYPALILAWQLMIMPQGILGQAMGTAAFPTLASLAARNALDGMRQILTDSLRMLLFLGLPASALLMTLGKPLIVFLFQRGIFAADDTTLVAWALTFYALGLLGLMSIEVIARAFYALNDTLTPVLAGGAQLALMVVLSFWLSQSLFPAYGLMALGGLALGYSISTYLELLLLMWLLRRKMGGLNGRYLLDGSWRMFAATVAMAATSFFCVEQLAGRGAGTLWQLLAGGLGGGLAYLLICLLLRVPEVGWLGQVGRRLMRR